MVGEWRIFRSSYLLPTSLGRKIFHPPHTSYGDLLDGSDEDVPHVLIPDTEEGLDLGPSLTLSEQPSYGGGLRTSELLDEFQRSGSGGGGGSGYDFVCGR